MFDTMTITHVPTETNVALLAGGTSNERSISLKSAEGAREALEQAGYPVTVIDTADKDDLAKLINEDFDFGFICVHGKGGEDGAIQGFLETIGLPYTGAGILASAISMDKAKAKAFYERAGIPTPASMMLKQTDDITPDAILETMGGKVVVKVPTEGSSIGVYIVDTAADLSSALDEAFGMTDEVLIEKYVAGKELTCVVFGSGDTAQAFPVIEIIPQNASYDFESKYAPGGSKHVCPAELDKQDTERIQHYAIDAQNALGCQGVTRTDFILQDNGEVWALETNTIPGMTATSLLPDAARAQGISFPELCTMMVQSGLDAVR